MIYDFFEDVGAVALVVFVAITALCLGLFLFLLVTGIVRVSRKKFGGLREGIVLFVACLVPLVIALGLLPQALRLGRAQGRYQSGNCLTVTGTLTSPVLTEEEGYRGGPSYTVSFAVDEKAFSVAIPFTDRTDAERIAACEGRMVTVWYDEDFLYGENGWSVYGISVIDTNE